MAYALAAALPDEHIVLDLPDESRDGVVAALLDT